MDKRNFSILLVLSLAMLGFIQGAAAEEGVTEHMMLIGIEGYTGSFSADEENLGFEVYVKHINDQGGIHGRKIELRGYERKGGVQEALANAKRLVEEDKVFCLFNFGGMPLAMALTPYVMEKKVPYLFPHQGSETLAWKAYVFTSLSLLQRGIRYHVEVPVSDSRI